MRLVLAKFSAALNGERFTSVWSNRVIANVPMETIEWILELSLSRADRSVESNDDSALFASVSRSTSNSSKKMTTGRVHRSEEIKASRKDVELWNIFGRPKGRNFTLSSDQNISLVDSRIP